MCIRDRHPVILESMEFPEPVIELAIEPKTKAGQGKLGEALAKLAEEDPTSVSYTHLDVYKRQTRRHAILMAAQHSV